VNKYKTSDAEAAQIRETPKEDWANVLLQAEILKVRIFKDRYAVVSQLLHGENINSPYDVRFMEFQDGKWINVGNNRKDSEEEIDSDFANDIESGMKRFNVNPDGT